MANDPLISVILPVYDAGAYLSRALDSIAASTFEDYELIVIDDGSTDATPSIIARHQVDVHVRNARNMGVSAARNLAVGRARGKILYFTDADVVLAPDTLARVAAHFAAGERAVIGLYAAEHPNPGLCSRYKNAWIRYSYLAAPARAGWFFTAVGAVDRELFLDHGGFDAELDVRTGGSDIDFGRRLADDGVAILLDKELAVVHLKSYSFVALMRNDISRAYGFSRLALASGRNVTAVASRGVGNVSGTFAVSTLLAGITLTAAALAAASAVPAWPAAAAAIGYAAVNRGFYRHAAGELGGATAASCVPLLFVDHLVCGAGVAAALAKRFFTVR